MNTPTKFQASKNPLLGPVNFLIEHTVQPGMQSNYESWLKKIIPVAASFEGHQGVEIIRPQPNSASTKYSIHLRFGTSPQLEAWMTSPQRAQLIDEVQPMLTDGERFTVKSGLDFWFTPDEAKAKLPTRWKQALITWSVIFPLVMGVPYLWKPVFVLGGVFDLHAVQTLLITGSVVAIVVYIVMPRYTRLVHRWLFR